MKKESKTPKLRFPTQHALEQLAVALNLTERVPEWEVMAGYSYTPSNPADIEEYLEYYFAIDNDDEKFVLMEMILGANAEQATEAGIRKYWQRIQPILIKDYPIHEYTIYYWKDMLDNWKKEPGSLAQGYQFLSDQLKTLINQHS